MKKVLFIIAAIILGIIALSSVGPMIGMAISLLIVYFSLKQFLATTSTFAKIIWAIIGLVGISGLFSSLPALVGVVAVYILYTGYQHWKQSSVTQPVHEDDPFTGFEKEWEKLEKTNR